MEENKKDRELKVLNLVIEHGFPKNEVEQEIMRLITGNELPREFCETPDFLRITKDNDGNDDVVGIELFRVDHHAKRAPKNKVASNAAEFENTIRTVYEKWHDTDFETDGIQMELIKDLEKSLTMRIKHHEAATYGCFLESFKYALEEHVKKVDAYYEAMNRFAEGKNKKLIFLIEIHTDFDKLYYYDKNGKCKNENIIPIFEDVVTLLETIDINKVDYLILCFGELIYNKRIQVVFLPTENIRNYLRKCNIPIYEYVGHDLFLTGFQPLKKDVCASIETKKVGDKLDMIATINSRPINNEQLNYMIFGAYLRTELCRFLGKNYATTDKVRTFQYNYKKTDFEFFE